MNLYMFEVKKSIPIENDCRYINWINVNAKTEDSARNILFEEFKSKEWLNKESVQCFAVFASDIEGIVDYRYDL